MKKEGVVMDAQVVREAWAAIDNALKRRVADLEPHELEAWGVLRHVMREMMTPTYIFTADYRKVP